MNTPDTDIGIAMLELDIRLDRVAVFAYRLKFDGDSELETTQLTRRGAGQLSYANGSIPITDLGDWQIVALGQLNQPTSDWQGVCCQATDEHPMTLNAHDEQHREAIKRLLNQALMQGARHLARANQGQISADYGAGNRVELTDTEPSRRIPFRSDYLSAFKTVTMTPEVFPDGTAWIGFNVRHRLMPFDTITVEWVLRHKPEWLSSQGIKRVRHRYARPGKGYATAQWLGVADDLTPMSTFQTAQGEISYFDYHLTQGNIPQGEEQIARTSTVVRLSYGKNNQPLLHLASLIQPMFDFDTLQQIDSPLLEKIALKLKWPVDERLKAAAEMIEGIQIPYFNARLRRIDRMNDHAASIKPFFNLIFAHGKQATSEKEVIKLGAYQGMTRKRIVPMIATTDPSDAERAKNHFKQIQQTCDRWSKTTSPAWTKAPTVADAEELDSRLTGKDFSDSLLLIGLGKQADKRALRDVAYRHGIATQFMRLDHPPQQYQAPYYNNLAAGVFSKAGGMICALKDMPGDTELFIGLDFGGVSQRAPGMAFLFTQTGTQLGWQLADTQRGERMTDKSLEQLLDRSLKAFMQHHDGQKPKRMTLHRDGRFYESLDVIQKFEQTNNLEVDVLEVIKSGAPPLFRRGKDANGKITLHNPEVGDAVVLPGLDELIIATYSGDELGKSWGNKVTVRPLRLRKRHGATDLATLAQQVILLSRIHGASLYRHPRLPVTTHHADRFATLRQECNLDDLSKMDRLCPVYL